MKQLILIGFLLTSVWGQLSVERQVQDRVRKMLKEDGRVTFSKLYNNSEFSPEERQYLGRLYEIIFAIPAYLRDYFQSSGKIPTATEMAQHFGIGEQSVLLLLEVLESDSRVPDLYLREPKSGQITSLNMERIERFLERRGSKVRVTQWEGMSLPGFEVKTLENERLSNDQILGHNALLYFWFTGCPPCVRIAPILAELANEYQPSGFRFYGFNADDILEIGTNNKARQTYLLKQGIHFLNANLNNATREAFGNVNVYPTLFFVNRNGIIVRHLVNFQTRATLVDVIKQMLE